MFFDNIKKEIFYLRKAFNKGCLFLYLKNKFCLAKKIFNKKDLDRQPEINNLSVHMLLGHRQMVLACLSLASFYKKARISGKLFLHSDGSLTDKDKKILKNLFGHAQVVEEESYRKFLNKLEVQDFLKKIRQQKTELWTFKKLFDPYLVSDADYRLVIDSDLVWFRQADEIKKVFEEKQNKSLMTYTTHAVGRVKFKNGSLLEDELAVYNSGIVLYKKENFNLQKLSDYFEQVDLTDTDKNYTWFIEQAAYASCLDNLVKLPIEKYHVKGRVNEQTVVRHYTGPRRVDFFTEGFEKIKKDIL